MDKIIQYIKSRVHEPSTLRGLVLVVVGLSGANLEPEQTQELVTYALGIVGIFGLLPDKVD